MNEAEWLSINDPRRLADWYEGETSPRRLRLFACACARLLQERIYDGRSWLAVELAERFADGDAAIEAANLARAAQKATEARQFLSGHTLYAHDLAVLATASEAPAMIWTASRAVSGLGTGLIPRVHLADLFRDVFGNPFRPVLLNPGWLTADVRHLAQAAYEGRITPAGIFDPASMSVLADALEDAGCTNPAVLDHCRSPGRHVRGCWLVDLLMDRR